MAILIAGLILFLGVHSVSIVNEPWRNRMAASIGEMGWKAAYSVVALVGLILVIYGYDAACFDPVPLYAPPTWLRHLSFLFLLPVFPLLIAAYMPGRISRLAKHPMVLAVKLWAVAHLLANGTLADVLLFGAFLAWAVAERVSLKRRTPRPVPSAPESNANDVIVIVAGLAVYGLFFAYLHRVLIGVPVI